MSDAKDTCAQTSTESAQRHTGKIIKGLGAVVVMRRGRECFSRGRELVAVMIRAVVTVVSWQSWAD